MVISSFANFPRFSWMLTIELNRNDLFQIETQCGRCVMPLLIGYADKANRTLDSMAYLFTWDLNSSCAPTTYCIYDVHATLSRTTELGI